MVSRGYKMTFEFTDELYAKYEAWCKENHLDGYHGAIGGSHHFEVTPTSIGEFVDAVATVSLRDEAGNVSYDEKGRRRTKEVRMTLWEP